MNLNDWQALAANPLGQLVEKINQVFWVCSADLSKMLYVNPAYERIWGRPITNFDAGVKSFIEHIYIPDRERVNAAIQTLSTGVQLDEEYRIVCQTGEIRWVHNRAVPYFDATGNIQYITGLIEDITNKKIVELALKESEQKFQQFANNVDIVFWVCEPDASKFYYINPGYEKIWGKSCDDIYQNPRSFIESVHPDDLERVIAVATGEEACNMDEEYRIIRPDGVVRWVRDRTFPVYDEQGNLFRMAGIAYDITIRKQAEEETLKALQRARELSDAKSNFIANTSHEIRTPLATIQSSMDMLQYYYNQLTENKKQGYFQKIEVSVERIAQIIQDILILAEAEANSLQFQPCNTDIRKLFSDAITSVTSSYSTKKNIELSVKEDITVKAPYVDPKLLTYIITNLLNNALKYSPEDSKVQLSLSCTPTQLTFSIDDKGIGIPVEDLPHIFDSFYRSHNVGNTSGTGLGLAIVKQCVDLHNGQISVNTGKGNGTTFTVTIPINGSHDH